MSLHGTYICLLDTPSITDKSGCRALRLRYKKALGLLGFLATERNRNHSRAYIASLLWPDFDEATARINLRQSLSVVTKLFSNTSHASSLVVNRDFIALHYHPHLEFDIDYLEREENVEDILMTDTLLTGVFLSGYNLIDCEEFEGWLEDKRNFYRNSQIKILTKLLNNAQTKHKSDQVIQLTTKLLKIDPDNESLLCEAMTLCNDYGKPQLSLKLYEHFCQRLARDLKAKPSTVATNLYENILNLSQKSITIPTHTNQFPAVEKMAPVVVVHIQWRCHLTDPEAIAQSLYDADLFARKVLCTEINAFHLSSAGRGAFFYFGWPKALDDNAWLAIRGVLRLLQFANTHPDLELRAALHTGVLLSSIKNSIPDLLGDITEETGLLCQSAHDGQALISERCYQLVKHRIKAQKVIEHRRRLDGTLKTSYLLIDMQNWIQEDHSTFYYSELIEFHEELSKIFCQTKENQKGELVHIVSPAGTGKTTQVSSWFTRFFNKNQLNNFNPIKLNCYPDRQKYPLFPIISWIRQLCGGLPDYPTEISDAMDFFNSITCNHFYDFSNLMGIITNSIAPTSQQFEFLYKDLICLFNYYNKDSLIIWIEDAHWIDETTHHFLELLTDKMNEAALVIITARQLPFPSRLNKRHKITVQRPSSISATQLIRFFNAKKNIELTSDKIDKIIELSNFNIFILEHIGISEKSTISLPLQHYFSFKIDQTGVLIEQALEQNQQATEAKQRKETSTTPLLTKTLETLTPPTHLAQLNRILAIKLTKTTTNKEPDIFTQAKLANYWLKSGENLKSEELYEKIANQTYEKKEYRYSAEYFNILIYKLNTKNSKIIKNQTNNLIKLIHSRLEAYGPSDLEIPEKIIELIQLCKQKKSSEHLFLTLALHTLTAIKNKKQKEKTATYLLRKSDCNIKKCISHCLLSYTLLLNDNTTKAILHSSQGIELLSKTGNKEFLFLNRETIFFLYKILIGLCHLKNQQITLAKHCAEELLELKDQKKMKSQLTDYDECRILFFSAFIMCHTNQNKSLRAFDLIHQCIDISSRLGQPLWTSASKLLCYINNNEFNYRNTEIKYHLDNLKVNFRELYPLLLSLKKHRITLNITAS